MSALLADRSFPTGSSQKDRFLAFAFAASDLLVEVSADGAIGFAAGAFQARFGLAPEKLVGHNINRLFAAVDRQALELALSTTAMRGRLAPLVLRLADAAGTPMVLSGLAAPSVPGRLCFTLGRLPSLPGPPSGADAPGGVASFTRLAEEWVQTADGGALGLLEMPGLATAQASLPADAQRALQSEISDVLHRLGGPGSVSGEIAKGRFGVLTDTGPDLEAIAAGLEAALRGHDATAHTTVRSSALPLDRDGLTGAQAARALRFALGRFAEGGIDATAEAGLTQGLASFIVSAQSRTKFVRDQLAGNRFRLAYQPVVSLGSRVTHHFEALLRPALSAGSGIETTQDFVTFAEVVGLSEELDWAVMRQAVAAVAATKDTLVAVNVSGLSMQSPQFCERTVALLSAQVQPGRLLVELTETADIRDIAAASATIDTLRAMGVPVCLDDFGAGSAALRYLRDFRVDYVKLDGAYVRGALQNAREHAFLLSMIELANFMGAKLIAEMIEQEEQAAMMRELGVEYGQGWLFGKPGRLPGTLGA